MTTEQLGFEVEPDPVYGCCGAPRPPGTSALDYPHAEDCPNPNLGVWFDRWGRTINRLCCTRERPCPPGGCRQVRDKLLPVLYRR